MKHRDARQTLAQAINPHRLKAAEEERHAFEEFCRDHDIATGSESVCLYLLSDEDEAGVRVRARVARLDLASHLRGEQPPSASRAVRNFLRGRYSIHPLGPQTDLCEPLYPGDIRTIVDSIVQPGWQQRRDHAYLLTMNASGLRWAEMNRLSWQDISLRRDHVRITTQILKGRYGPRLVEVVLERRRRRLLCPVTALHALHQTNRPAPARPVFSTRGGNVKSQRLRAIAHEIDQHRMGVQRLGEPTLPDKAVLPLAKTLLAPTAIAKRDRFMVLVGFLAGLTPTEAQNLLVGDVVRTPRGLLLHLPNRRHSSVPIAARPGSPYCPRAAWNAWHRVLRQTGHDAPHSPAFVGCDPYLANLGDQPLLLQTFTETVAGHAAEAGLLGHYTYSSLKDGLIRAATIAGTPHHAIAAHVGHRTLVGITSRSLEETAMSSNILRLIAL